jgi:uncharacterized protein (TIGR02147 family)
MAASPSELWIFSLESFSVTRSVSVIDAQQELRSIMLEALSHARARNPSYSLRAFAKRISIGPSAVSEILSGTKSVSVKMTKRILDALSIYPEARDRIIAGMTSTDTQSKQKQARDRQQRLLTNDEFRIVTDWYHFAILSILETKDPPTDATAIANRLGLTQTQVKDAIERLRRLDMIRVYKDDSFHLTGQSFHTTDQIPSSAIRASHAQALELAKDALVNTPVELRDFTTLTFAVDPSRLEKAKTIIRKFRTEIASTLDRSPQNDVYMLSIQLFPLTRRSL